MAVVGVSGVTFTGAVSASYNATDGDVTLADGSVVTARTTSLGGTLDLALPGAWTDTQFVPFDYAHFAMMYDTDTMATPPTSFEELIALPDSVKITIQDPRSSTPGFGLVLWIKAAYGDRAKEIWQGLKPHIMTVTRDWSESYDLFLSGEADMTLSYTTSPSYHLIEDGDAITLVDALFPASIRHLHTALRAIGREPGDVRALILTHGHFDHLGMADALADAGLPDGAGPGGEEAAAGA